MKYGDHPLKPDKNSRHRTAAQDDTQEQIAHLVRLVESLNREKERFAQSREKILRMDIPWVQANETLESDWRENVQPLVAEIKESLKDLHGIIRAYWSGKWRWNTFLAMLAEGKDNYEKWKASGWPDIHVQELQVVSRAVASIKQRPSGGDGGDRPRSASLPIPQGLTNTNMQSMEWDVFISHASEDKDAFVRPLVDALERKGVCVWLDERVLTVGDSLRRRIEEGLAHSRYAIVVVSPDFVRKEWAQKELDGLFAKEADGQRVILPVWHNVDAKSVQQHFPMLVGKWATSTDKGIDVVVADLIRAMQC